jgi:hypothetical protein
MKTMLALLSLLSISSSAFADSMSQQCIDRIGTVFASIPGDDGTFFSKDDVKISNIVATMNPPDAKGQSWPTVAATLNINSQVGSASGSVVASDSPGGCYINQLTFQQ